MGPVIKYSIIGQSEAIRNIKRIITKVSNSDANVLIIAETGTGKELVARSIHDSSKRQNHTFEAINCGAFPENLLESELFGHEKGAFTGAIKVRRGIFETADKGTVFLDEIGDAPQYLQTRLLRILEEKEFKRVGGTRNILTDFRLICATNQNLVPKVNEGNFRSDLFYRINVIHLHIPPLHDHMEDIPELINHFLEELAASDQKFSKSLQTELEARALTYNWPGNIRELKNYVETTIALNNPDVYFEQDLLNSPSKRSHISIESKSPDELVARFNSVSNYEAKARILEDIIRYIYSHHDSNNPLLYEQLRRGQLEKLIGCSKDMIINTVHASNGTLYNFVRNNGHFEKKKTSNSFIFATSLLNHDGIAS